MAEAPQRRGERRAAARAQNEEEGRRTRQHLDDLEVRLDSVEFRMEQRETRVSFLESHIKIILRGFEAILNLSEPRIMTSGWLRPLLSLPSSQR